MHLGLECTLINITEVEWMFYQYVDRRQHAYNTAQSAFVMEVLVCEQQTQIKAMAFSRGWQL